MQLDIPAQIIKETCPKVWEYILIWEQKTHEEILERIKNVQCPNPNK